MRMFLRIVAVLVALAVVLTLLMVIQFAFSGGFTALVRSGGLGMVTIAAWFIILTTGPVASIQLWRLRRVGLFVTAMLCGLVFQRTTWWGSSFFEDPRRHCDRFFGPLSSTQYFSPCYSHRRRGERVLEGELRSQAPVIQTTQDEQGRRGHRRLTARRSRSPATKVPSRKTQLGLRLGGR